MAIRDLESFMPLLHILSIWFVFYGSKCLGKCQSLCLYSRQQKEIEIKRLILLSKSILRSCVQQFHYISLPEISHTATPHCKEGWGIWWLLGLFVCPAINTTEGSTSKKNKENGPCGTIRHLWSNNEIQYDLEEVVIVSLQILNHFMKPRYALRFFYRHSNSGQ